MTKELVTLKTGNTSWWKNRKYRWEAALSIRELRKSGFKVKRIKTYRSNGANTLIYSEALGFCLPHISKYLPFRDNKLSWVPCSIITPLSSTMI